MSGNILQDNNYTSSSTKHLQSEIINQKKQFIFKVEQTSDFVYPNERYKYYIYLKNISGVTINNIHVIVNNSGSIALDETGENPIEIGSMKNDEVKLIYLSAECVETGVFYTHFVCYGDNTGLFYKTLKIVSNYNNTTGEVIHRIHIYDFTPYEETYRLEADDYSNQVTQLFKKQKLPYKAGEHPYSMKRHDSELDFHPFENVESESFINEFNTAQKDNPKTNLNEQFYPNHGYDEHHYSYIGRENFNANAIESFEGTNLNQIIENINNNSQYFNAKFLQTGTNELANDFYEYTPNGFIYRFGLLGSEIYHNIGVLPTYTYMSDYLFRWAPDGSEPLNLIPEKKPMIWDSKKWAGHEWRVYRIATPEYMASDDWQEDLQAKRVSRWEIIDSFHDLESAETFVNRMEHNDDIIESRLMLDYSRFQYMISETFYDTGVFYVNIPIGKIPSNFYLLSTEDIQAIIQRSKPYGVKALIRYVIEKTFEDEQEMLFTPVIKPYINIDIGDISDITYYIQNKKFKKVTTKICNQNITQIKLVPHGKGVLYQTPFESNIMFKKEDVHPRIAYTAPYAEHDYTKQYSIPKNNAKTPDNNFSVNIEQENDVNATVVDNAVTSLGNITDILYQNNADNIGFNLTSYSYRHPNFKANISTENNFIIDLAKKNNYSAYSYKLTEFNTEGISGYRLVDEQKQQKYNTFKIPIINKNVFNRGDSEIGIGVLDTLNRYHYLSVKYDLAHKSSYIKYSTSFNNKYVDKKIGMQDITGLVITSIKVGFKNLIIFFVEEGSRILHYFHHNIVNDITEVFTYASENLLITETNGQTPHQKDITEIFYCDLIYKNPIIWELPFVKEYHIYNTYNISGGENWTNLYRIDRAENSYTYIQNKDIKLLDVDSIVLHFDDINIPDNSIIEDIQLRALINSSASSQIFCSSAAQGNLNFSDANGNRISFKPSKMEFYQANKESQYLYDTLLTNAYEIDNEKLIQQYKTLLIENIVFDESINIEPKQYLQNHDDFITLSHSYWTELSDFTYQQFNSNNIETIEFVIEGYNSGKQVDMESQLLCEQDNTNIQTTSIQSGYFYKKITMPFKNSFKSDDLRLRFKFNHLVEDIKIFNTYINISFKTKEKQDIVLTDTDDTIIKDKEVINLSCLNDEIITTEEISNGFTVQLDFDSLSPGDFYRIYFAELNITYRIINSELMINKDKFNYVSYDEAFTVVSGQSTTPYLSGLFYNDVATAIQAESSLNIDNHGLELKDKLYQSFIANSDNITSIELYPNGFIGSPSDTLKIGLYSNHGNTPYKLIKEIYASGWVKTNPELKDLYSIKYNFNINNLNIGERYWIKIEVENPNPNSCYLLRYTPNKKDNFTLLLEENNNYINTFGALEFNVYSKNLTRSFGQLPAVQDYFNNPYILIGIHKSGTIEKLSVKKKGC